MLVHHDSSAAPQTVQTASPVCGTKNFVSVRLFTRRRNCIGQLSPSSEYAPAARQINPNISAIILRLVALYVWRVDPAPNDPVLLAAKDGAAGGGCALMRTLGRYSRRNDNGRG